MRAVLALAAGPGRLAAGLRGGATGGAGGRLLTPAALSVVAFALTNAFGLSVVGGLLGFVGRAAAPTSYAMTVLASQYVVFAWVAVVLLLVPLVSLGAAAARLGVARRDSRLATLRLLGVTGGEVVALTVLETAKQGLLGAGLGIGLYGALMPVWTRIPFMGETFAAADLWVGWWGLAMSLVVIPLIAAVSGAVSLRRVVVTPLGVARRQTPPGMRWVRALAVVAALGAFVLVLKLAAGIGVALFTVVMLLLLAAVLGTVNLVGPWTISVMARVMARRARTPARLLAARRLLDDPRAAWRVVGGLGLASFVAGVLSVLPALSAAAGGEDATGDLMSQDLVTGGLLTLAIAFTMAAASAGITQAASVLDRRQEYALQQLAGVPVELFDRVRRRVVLTPLVLVAGTSAAVAMGVLLPVFGLALVTAPQGLVTLLACLVGGGLLVLAATETTRPLMWAVLRETVVRPD